MSQWRDREAFKARVLEWAAKFEVKVHGLYVRPMRAHLGEYEDLEARMKLASIRRPAP